MKLPMTSINQRSTYHDACKNISWKPFYNFLIAVSIGHDIVMLNQEQDHFTFVQVFDYPILKQFYGFLVMLASKSNFFSLWCSFCLSSLLNVKKMNQTMLVITVDMYTFLLALYIWQNIVLLWLMTIFTWNLVIVS